MKKSLVLALAVPLLGTAPAAVYSAPAAVYRSTLQFSGVVTSNGQLYLETRTTGGTPLYSTGLIPLTAGESANTVRDNSENEWRVGSCAAVNPGKLIVYEGQNFTVWASTTGTLVSGITTVGAVPTVFSEITPGTPFTTNGITISMVESPIEAVPTLTEWGLILFAVTMAGTGAWFLSRRARVAGESRG